MQPNDNPNLPASDSGHPFLNAIEAWSIYDTIQIRNGATEKEGYESYAALGADPIWPFFDQRKQNIGIAYTNRDSNEALEFAYEVYSLGCRFVAPEGIMEEAGGVAPGTGQHNMFINSIFSRMILEHVGIRFKVEQDDKLIHSCYLAPDGLGPNTPSLMTAPALAVAAAQIGISSPSNTNGEPHISGRWKFPAPVEIPKGAVFSARMEPSTYCRDLLQVMVGPSNYLFYPVDAEVEKPSCALIRMDIIGKRGVQQRNALHR